MFLLAFCFSANAFIRARYKSFFSQPNQKIKQITKKLSSVENKGKKNCTVNAILLDELPASLFSVIKITILYQN
jgi:hypothetical protein